MKKLLLGFVMAFALVCADVCVAQQDNYPVFSSSLGGGSSYYNGTRRTMYTPRGQGAQRQAPVRKQKVCKTTVIKYQPGQMELSEQEKEKYIAPIIQRIQKEEVKSLSLVSFANMYTEGFNRVNPLSRFFFAYGISPKVDIRSGLHAIRANVDTIEITECR